MLWPLLASALMLTACADFPTPTLGLGSPTPKAEDLPNSACNQFAIVHVNEGKPDLAVADIAQVIAEGLRKADAESDILSTVRNYVGDTKPTREEVRGNNAAWHTLCDPKPGS